MGAGGSDRGRRKSIEKKERDYMRKMKVVALMMAAAVVFTACGKKNDGGEPTTTPTPTETITPTEEPTPTPETPDDDIQGEDGTGDEGNTGDTGEAGDENLPAVSEELDKIHTAVMEAFGEDYIPNMPYDKTAISELFGVSEDWYDYAVAEGPMISMHVDTFVAIHATEGNLENVQNALNNYREVLVNDTMQYPMNMLKIQGSKVVTSGDYVFFIMLGYLEDDTAYDTDEAAIEAYAGLNQKAVDAINSILGE